MSQTEDFWKRISVLSGENLPEDIHEPENKWKLDLARRDSKTFEEAKTAIRKLADIVNGSGNDTIMRSAIVAEMLRTHRYLQNELINTLILSLGDLGTMFSEEPNSVSDARNAWALELCKKLRDKLDKDIFFGFRK